VTILFTMLIMGLLLGFVGAGGAGVVIAVLTTVFGIPIHTALGTSLGAMAFTTLSGAYSHFREGNVNVKIGIPVGIIGAAGAFTGAKISSLLPADNLKWLTAGMLVLSAILIYVKVFYPEKGIFGRMQNGAVPGKIKFWLNACGLGFVTGLLSGTFGIGATPFIQIGLLFFFNVSLYQAVGTTMFVILPIAVLGGFGYMTAGYFDFGLFIKVVLGLMLGAYIGAKFTRRLYPIVLKTMMVAIPLTGAVLLAVGP
jgi:uncharacterized protein